MKYDFTSVIDRHGFDSIAVDPNPESPYRKGIELKYGITDHIPMWVADMNFPACPTIPAAIIARASHPAYGYFETRKEYYDSIIEWQSRQHGVTGLEAKHIGYENGVLGGVVSALRAIAAQGDCVLVHSPTYIGFTHVLNDNGYRAIHSPLVKDAEGIWRMDYEDMERKLADHKIHAAIFCSPHNPTGRVWERGEIETAMEIFRKYDVYVISDEIWSDIILDGYKHVPTQSVSDDARSRTIAEYAPSKTFNLAGLIGSYHIIYNDRLRDRVDKESSLCHYNSMNVLSMHALLGAYQPEGYEWKDELCRVLGGNVDYACAFIRENFRGVTLSKPQGTYMLYLDCTDWLTAHGKTTPELLRMGWEVGVDWQDGEAFLCPNTIRMNLALPRSRVEEAFGRLKEYVFG